MEKKLLVISMLVIVGSLSIAGCTINLNTPSSPASPTPTPTPQTTIMQAASSDPNLSTFVSLLQRGNFTGVLSEPGNYTVFAPTNAAFSQINASNLDELQSNLPALDQLLLNHIVGTRLTTNDFQGSGTMTMLTGSPLSYSTAGTTVRIGTATIVSTGIETSNGVLYEIDNVLVPSVGG